MITGTSANLLPLLYAAILLPPQFRQVSIAFGFPETRPSLTYALFVGRTPEADSRVRLANAKKSIFAVSMA